MNKLDEIRILISNGGFPDERALLSFCLSLGVFHNRKVNGKWSGKVEVEELTSFDMCSLVINEASKKDLDINGMKKELEMSLLGGIEMVVETIKGANGLDPLLKVSKLLPP